MFEVKNVTKTFGDVVAVNNVSFNIEQPQMIGIIGRSGAGKSTLLRTINRLVEPDSGEVICNNVDVIQLKGALKREWQSSCAMIFQQFNLVPRLDVLTNVILGKLNKIPAYRSLLKIFNEDERMLALSILDRFGMAETCLKRAEHLSGGQQPVSYTHLTLPPLCSV